MEIILDLRISDLWEIHYNRMMSDFCYWEHCQRHKVFFSGKCVFPYKYSK